MPNEQTADISAMADFTSAHRPLVSHTEVTPKESEGIRLALLIWAIGLVVVVLAVLVATHGVAAGVGPFAALGS